MNTTPLKNKVLLAGSYCEDEEIVILKDVRSAVEYYRHQDMNVCTSGKLRMRKCPKCNQKSYFFRSPDDVCKNCVINESFEDATREGVE